MSVISPVNQAPVVDTGERSPSERPVSLAERVAERLAERRGESGVAPKKKKVPATETAEPAVAALLTPARHPSRWAGGAGGHAPALASPQSATVVAAADATAAAPAVATDGAEPTASVAPTTLPTATASTSPTVSTAASSAATVPAGVPNLPNSPNLPNLPAAASNGPATATRAAPPTPVSSTDGPALRRDPGDPTTLATADVAAPPVRSGLLATAARPSDPGPPPRAPAPASTPTAPAPAAPTPGMTVAFQTWGEGHRVHAQWMPAGVVLTPSSDRVGQALANAAPDSGAIAAGEQWRIEAVDDQRQSRERSRRDQEHDSP
jgi:hypothetical protein